jgi:ATP-binding cassette subfamily F protein 3
MIASPLLRLEGASAGYLAGQPILRNLDLRIDNDDRIALLGQNGNGKSTFAKLIAGRLKPLSGHLLGAQKVEVGYFAQHQLDDLNPIGTPYDYMLALMPEATEAQRRGKLGAFGFGAGKADTKCQNLSGGEKARLLLALTAFHAPNLLILDEPTNHLDVDSREALIHALMDYDGAVILISHDRHLVEATADRLWIVKGGTVTSYEGDMESYRGELLAERGQKARERSSVKDPGEAPAASRADSRRASAERRAQLAPLKKAVVEAEKAVEKLQREIGSLDVILADSTIYTRDPAKAQTAAQVRGRLAKQLADAEEIWLRASEEFEALETAS